MPTIRAMHGRQGGSPVRGVTDEIVIRKCAGATAAAAPYGRPTNHMWQVMVVGGRRVA